MKNRLMLMTAVLGFAGATYADNPPRATPAGGAPVNNQVGGEQYGNNTQKAPLYGPQSNSLPSEALIATQRSGALPSEIRAQQDAVGPLAASGAQAYIPEQSTIQRAAGVRPPALFSPAYGPRASAPPVGTVAPLPLNVVRQEQGFSTPSAEPGSVAAPAGVYVPPVRIEPQAVPTGYRISRAATGGEVSTGEGTVVRYLPRPAATQPAPSSPSAADALKR